MTHKPKHNRHFLFRPSGGPDAAETAWRPRADMYRTEFGWLLKFELAGVPPEDIAVHAGGRKLTVTGIRRDFTPETICSHYLMEISYNRFERIVELPCEIDACRIEVEHRNGILIVRVTTEGEAR